MVKLKRSTKNLELDINVAKTGNSAFFCGKQQIPRHGMKICIPRNTGGHWPCIYLTSSICRSYSKTTRQLIYGEQRTYTHTLGFCFYGEHLSKKPGNDGEFDSCRGSIGQLSRIWEILGIKLVMECCLLLSSRLGQYQCLVA